MELWLQRPKRERTADDVLAFYGWLSDHQAKLVPNGPAPVRQLREMLKQHIVEAAEPTEKDEKPPKPRGGGSAVRLRSR